MTRHLRWEAWIDLDGAWIGQMDGDHCLQVFGPFTDYQAAIIMIMLST